MRPLGYAFLAAFLAAPPLVAADGDLKTSFGSGGIFAYGDTTHLRAINGVVAAPDGAVVVFGQYHEIGAPTTSGLHWRRVTTDGVGGECNLLVPSTSFSWIRDADFDLQGRLIVVGAANQNADSKNDFVVARFNYPACDLDESFDTDGIKTFDFDGSSDASGTGIADVVYVQTLSPELAPDPDIPIIENDIVVAGDFGPNNVAAARLNDSGSFDSVFDSDGKSTFDLGRVERSRTLLNGPGGSVLMLGQSDAWDISNTDLFVLAIDPATGEGVSGFGVNAWARIGFDLDSIGTDSPGGLVSSDENRIYVAGWTVFNSPTYRAAVAELDANGGFTSSFDGDGKRAFSAFTSDPSITYGQAIVQQTDDKLVVAGRAEKSGTFGPGFYVARLLPTGALDSTFASTGLKKYAYDLINGKSFSVSGAALLEGRIVIVGYGQDTGVNRSFIALLENALLFADDFESANTYAWSSTSN